MRTDDEHRSPSFAHEGDAPIFAEIDRGYRRPLTDFATRLLGCTQDAEDVVQEALVRACDRSPDGMSASELSAWLHRVVRNACFDLLRHRRRAARTLDRLAPATGSGEDAYAAALRRQELAAVVGDVQRLPARQRDAVILACVDGLPHAEVARRLESTVPATKSLLLRARANLHRMARGRDELAERSRRAVVALLAPMGKLASVTGATAPAAMLSVAAIAAPVVLSGAGRVVSQQTVPTGAPAPRPLEYGPFRIDHGAPLPEGVRLEEATVELPAGESAPETRRLSITCPQGFVQAGISTHSDAVLDRFMLSDRSSLRMGKTRRGVIVFRPRPNLSGRRTVRLGIECATPEYWRRVAAVYGDWAECDAIRDEVRQLRRHGRTVPRGLLRARRLDCRAAQRLVRPVNR